MSADGANKRFTLVIDAGHGGHDSGALGTFSKEKNLTLKFALAFGQMVERNCPDVKVIYTRKTDKFVELYRRAEIANSNKADLFISIHINAVAKGRHIKGFQTYTLGTSKRTGKKTGVEQNLEVAKRENAVILLEKNYKQTYQGYDPNSPESDIMFEFIQDKNMENSVELAKYMQRYVCQATGRQNMGAQQDNLAVLRLSSMPGCLIELGFISNRDEENYMNSKTAESQYARGIFNAFQAYRKRHGAAEIKIPYRAEPAGDMASLPQLVPQEMRQPESGKSRSRKPEEDEKTEQPQQPTPEQPVGSEPSAPSEQPVASDSLASLAGIDLSVVRDPRPAIVGHAPKRVTQLERPVVQSERPVVQQEAAAVQPQNPIEDTPPAPVFKVQILSSTMRLKVSDARFKGLSDIGSYTEGSNIKYTVGASEDYNELYRLRKSILDKFPEAFIVAFREGERIDVNEAIREFKKNKKK